MSDARLNPSPADPPSTQPLDVLPPGHRVAEFRIERVLGQGGFGIVYLAFDTRLERLVAVKEFMPKSLAQRLADGAVVPLSERHRATFELGLRSFIRESRALARFKHPALVEVYRFWEELGTAYMVMPFYEGRTLKQRLEGMAAPPAEAWLRRLALQVLEGLDVVHRQGWLHRDIAPDNILLLPGDRPVLLDFGSARQDIGDATQALAGLLKPGYAPIEQYGDSAALKQGPWTDLYAFGALLYFAVCGKVPPASVERVKDDAMVPARRAGQGRHSTAFLQFIDRCLALWPEGRPANIAVALELLRGLDAREWAEREKATGRSPGPAAVAALRGLRSRAAGGLSRWRKPLCWAGGLSALCLAGAGLVLGLPRPGPVPATPLAAREPAQPVPAQPADAPPHDDALAAPVAARPGTPLPVPSPPWSPDSAAPAAPAGFAQPPTPNQALEDLLRDRDSNIRVAVMPAAEKPKSGFEFRIEASEPGFLYVFATGARRDRLELLWPRDDESLVMIEPGRAWRIQAAAPVPADHRHVGVMVSKSARHLAGAGWQRQAGSWSKTFSGASGTGAAPWFGQPQCAPVPGPCHAGFGAVRFDVTYTRPPEPKTRPATPSPARLAAARKAECESLTHLLALDGNVLAQRRFAQLGCRR
ncbi:serine/threonine protein kinase [Azohydromonas aeria]|uniref:serine/threonine protein kinase n=1 Tax=Azohydromonas aeria TaxID=2590212 RepID=UPI0018DFE57F|nr:serine/threonine-protein kinase [Azohydromonas aeria]